MKLVSTILLVVLVALGVQAQSPATTPTPAPPPSSADENRTKLALELIRARVALAEFEAGDKTKADAPKQFTDLVVKVMADDPNFANGMISDALSQYTSLTLGARSAPQASQIADEATARYQFVIAAQNQVLIEQNKKIIALLEVIAKKPR